MPDPSKPERMCPRFDVHNALTIEGNNNGGVSAVFKGFELSTR
jgi:hypothetical protein